jgi:hypothetical protein
MHVYVFRNRRLYLHSSYAYFVCAGRACWAWKKQDIRDGTPRRGRQVSRIKKDSSKRKERRKVCGFGSMEMLNLMRSRFQVQEKREAVGR